MLYRTELRAAKASLAGLQMLKEGAECFREAAHEVRDAKNDKDKIEGAAPKKSMAKEMEGMIYNMILPLVLQVCPSSSLRSPTLVARSLWPSSLRPLPLAKEGMIYKIMLPLDAAGVSLSS